MNQDDAARDRDPLAWPLWQSSSAEDVRLFLAATLDALPAHCAILDETGRVVVVNRAWRDFADQNGGHDPHYGIGQNYLEICEAAGGEDAETARAVAAGLRWVMAGRAQRFELEYACPSLNQQQWFLLSCSRYMFQGAVYVLVAHLPITRRVLIEQAAREQHAFAEALANTASVLNSALGVDAVLERILENVGRVIPHDVGVIMLIGPDGWTTTLYSQDHSGRGLDRWARGLRLQVDALVNLRAARDTRRPQVISDTHADPTWRLFPESAWVRSTALMPIVRQDAVIGFLELDSATPGYFTQQHAARLQVFADQVATAMRNAELYQALQNHAQQLEINVQHRTAELRQQRAQLRAILEGLGEGVAYIEGTQVRYVNRALMQLLGFGAEDFPADLEAAAVTVFRALDFPVAQMQAEIAQEFQQGRNWQRELPLVRRDGTRFDAALTVAPVYDAAGEVLGSVTIVRDISQARALQARKTRFLTNAAHELRTPLTNLKTRLYLMRQNPQRLEQHLDVLDQVAEQMTTLMDDLLDVVRLEQPAQQVRLIAVDLVQTVRGVVEAQRPVAVAREVRLECALPGTPCAVCGDPERLAQAVRHLVVHAIQNTPAGAAVSVRLGMEQGEEGRQVVLRVQDGGAGFTAADLAQIFEPFFSASEANLSGLGLGLALAYEIVRLHDGTIDVESLTGEGTRFVVRLPAASAVCGA